jgi:RNA polymerase sigma factor (TIGR02999 family)
VAPAMNEVTRILTAVEQGDPHAAEQLLPLVYSELRKLAAQRLAQEKPGQTLQATALVHEAYLRLVPSGSAPSTEREKQWDGRGHFFAAAAEAMRRILVEAARKKARIKRGGGRVRVELDDCPVSIGASDQELLALDDALDKLTAADAVAARLVQLRYFAVQTIPAAADLMGISARTADRLWAYARAFIHSEMGRK